MSLGWSRRRLIAGGLGLSAIAALPLNARAPASTRVLAERMRVIVDNDLGGDPDGLFQLVQFALAPSVVIPLVVGTQYRDFGPAGLIPNKAARSARKARELLRLIPTRRGVPVLAGADDPLSAPGVATGNAVSAAIVREALRCDTALPLFYAAGGSLTELARAWLVEPRIGPRLRLVWIGGAEHPDLAASPPGPGEPEYNFALDRVAAQVLFNQSDIEIWQVPRNAFRQMLVSLSELEGLDKAGALGRFLLNEVRQAHERLAGQLPSFIYNPGETITLGDTALVTLTALQSAFQPDTASSSYVVRPTPTLLEDGSYRVNPSGRPMRIYNTIDAGLTMRDLLAKLRNE